MAENSKPPRHRSVPPLPRKLAEPTPVFVVGTLLWLVGLVIYGLKGWSSGQWGIQFWTCLAGVVLGGIGYLIFRWQRAASRRGSRGSWRGLTGLDG